MLSEEYRFIGERKMVADGNGLRNFSFACVQRSEVLVAFLAMILEQISKRK